MKDGHNFVRSSGYCTLFQILTPYPGPFQEENKANITDVFNEVQFCIEAQTETKAFRSER